MRVSSVYLYKSSWIYGVKLNGKEVCTAGSLVLLVREAGLDSVLWNSAQYFGKYVSEAGGKYFDPRKAKEIVAQCSMPSCWTGLLKRVLLALNFHLQVLCFPVRKSLEVTC